MEERHGAETVRHYGVWAFGTNPTNGHAEWWLAFRHLTARAAACRATRLNHTADEGYLYVRGSIDGPPRTSQRSTRPDVRGVDVTMCEVPL